jgi:hypothetical protein
MANGGVMDFWIDGFVDAWPGRVLGGCRRRGSILAAGRRVDDYGGMKSMSRLLALLAAGAVGAGLLMAGAARATADEVPPRLPPEVAMNRGAEAGKHVFVMVRVGHGDELPFVLDTGSSVTVFDESLEPQLGRRLRVMTLWRWGGQKEQGVYAAPHFYLGGTRLLAGPVVTTSDFHKDWSPAEPRIMGVLGMDVLGHYCVQLDFAAGKMRFLDADHADKSKWGRAVPLVNIGNGCLAVRENLAGVQGVGSLIDTGEPGDGWLVPEVFQQWTNQMRPPAEGEVKSPRGVLAGEMYRQVKLRSLDAKALNSGDLHMEFNGVGLHTLSRYVVTFDFPDRTMYLKRPGAWSLIF